MSPTLDADLLQYGALRPESRLLIQEEVAAPVFWVTLEAIVEERSAIGPIERFALRAISRGVRDPGEIAGLLGLERKVLDRSLIDLWQEDLIDLVSDPAIGRAAILTARGREAAAAASTIRTQIRPVEIAFDRLGWLVSSLPFRRLTRPKDVSGLGLRRLEPAHGRQPTVKDLPLQAVRQALEDQGVLSADPARRERDLVAIRSVKGVRQMFRTIDLVAYGPLVVGTSQLDPSDVDIQLGESGHLSRRLSMAFAATPQFRRFAKELAEPIFHEAPEIEPGILHEAVPAAEVLELQHRLAATEERIVQEERAELEAAIGPEPGTSRTEELRRERDQLREQYNSIEVRHLLTPDLAEALRTARYESRRRLLIISPWVNREVVDQDFLQSLGRLTTNGVRIHIGYGFPGDEGKDDPRTIKALNQLVDRTKGKIIFRRLGTTHEKVLIFDDTVVVGSFNWLSFKGDARRPLRREAGVLVRKPGYADEQYERYVAIVEGRDDEFGQG